MINIFNLCIGGWVPSSVTSEIPPDAVNAGYDTDGAPIFVGRAFHDGDQLPVKVMPTKRAAYVAYGGREIPVFNYEVRASDSAFPLLNINLFELYRY